MIRSSGVSRSITLLLIALAVTLIAHFLPDAETKSWGNGTSGIGAAPNTVANRNPDSVPVTTDEGPTGNPLKPPPLPPAPITTTSAGLTFGYLFGDTNDNSTIAIDKTGSFDRPITFSRGNNTSGTNTIDVPLTLAPASGSTSTFYQAGGVTQFKDTATASNGTFTNIGATVSGAGGGATYFFGSSTASNATIANNGATVGGDPTWGNTATDFNAGSSWVGGVGPGTTDICTFSSATISFQPNVTANITVGGLNFTTTGWDLTSSNTSTTLQLSSTSSVDGLAAITIASGGGTNTIDAPLRLIASLNNRQTFMAASGTTLVLNGVISSANNIILNLPGAGTVTLAGANTYTGTTTVNGGTLLVNGSLASGSAVTVSNSGTVLGGRGTINGTVAVNSSAAILGGNGTTGTTLTVHNSLTMNSGSIIELALGPSLTHSTLARTAGTWSFQSAQQFTFIDLGATTGTYTHIITGLASDPGTESGWTITNSGYTGTFFLDADGISIDLNLTAVPEPGTWVGGALAFAFVGYTQRRRFAQMLRRT